MLNKICFSLILFVTFAFSHPDSSKVKTLSTKIDSLSAVIHEMQLVRTYSEKSETSLIDTNKRVMDNQYAFMTWMGGILGTMIVAVGLFLWRRSVSENKQVAALVQEAITPALDSKFSDLQNQIRNEASTLGTHLRNYDAFAGQVEARFRGFEDLQIVDGFGALRTSIQETNSRVRSRLSLLLSELSEQSLLEKKFQQSIKFSVINMYTMRPVQDTVGDGEYFRILVKRFIEIIGKIKRQGPIDQQLSSTPLILF